VQLASRDECASRAVVIVALVALGLDVRVDRVGDPLASAARLMLVDERSALTVVPHPRHQILEGRSAVGRELVTSVPQVVDTEPL
jgi:hypothetical protein